MVKCKCVDCIYCRERPETDVILCPCEKYTCAEHKSTKNLSDIYAVRDCGQFIENPNPIRPCPKSLSLRKGQCQRCMHLRKIPYVEAHPTHHENWQCPIDGHTMMYDDTQAIRHCPSFHEGNPIYLSRK